MLYTMLHLIFSIVSLNGNEQCERNASDSIIYKNDSDGLRHP